MASSLGVEMLVSLLNHPERNGAKAREDPSDCDRSSLGILPQQLRGDLSDFSLKPMYGECFDKCIGCAFCVSEALKDDRENFLVRACNQPDYLEDLTGITKMNEAINLDDIEALSDLEWDD
jgi:ubiquitin-like modifier-activating enzyme ATG7